MASSATLTAWLTASRAIARLRSAGGRLPRVRRVRDDQGGGGARLDRRGARDDRDAPLHPARGGRPRPHLLREGRGGRPHGAPPVKGVAREDSPYPKADLTLRILARLADFALDRKSTR